MADALPLGDAVGGPTAADALKEAWAAQRCLRQACVTPEQVREAGIHDLPGFCGFCPGERVLQGEGVVPRFDGSVDWASEMVEAVTYVNGVVPGFYRVMKVGKHVLPGLCRFYQSEGVLPR